MAKGIGVGKILDAHTDPVRTDRMVFA